MESSCIGQANFRTIFCTETTRAAEVWQQSFSRHLAIRQYSHHGKCGTCMRQKQIWKRLGSDRVARTAQMLQYSRHLERQYADRMCYWRTRAASRLRALSPGFGLQTLCMIVDGMDKSKFRFPRTLLMQSKDLQGLQRPSLEMTACIAHGHALLLAIGDLRIHKDSSAICDILCHMLHKLSANGVDLRRCEVVLQADNTARETKNNTVLRMLGSFVCARRIARCEVRFLQSGHSHEDVDGFFANVTASLNSAAELHLPQDFADHLRRFLRQPQASP